MKPNKETTMNTKGMKCIGKGAFSTVYQSTKKKVLIKSKDNVKECMALGWFPDSPMFPKIERIGISECGQFSFYEQKFYNKVKGIKNNVTPSEWEFYQILRGLFTNSPYCPNMHDYLDAWREKFETIPNKFHHKRTMLLEALDDLSNYGTDICFEISPRNIAIHNRKIVLLDVFFFMSALHKQVTR